MNHQTPPSGMVRIPDHATSEKAANKVQRKTIRSIVLTFAEGMSNGFIDEQVFALNPDAPESSYRKRRSELTEEGFILDTGTERKNSKGQDCTVWIHRKFHPAPPPLLAVKSMDSRSRAKALARNKREKLMYNALVAAAPSFMGTTSLVGSLIAAALNIPFPITYNNIPAKRP